MQIPRKQDDDLPGRAWATLRVVLQIDAGVVEPMVLPGPEGTRILLAGSEETAESVLNDLARGVLSGAA